MPFSSWTGLLISQQVDGTALNTSTTETSILAAQAKYVLPANAMTYAGQALRIRAMGRISNIVTTPGTLTFRVKFGATAVAVTPALALNTTAKTNVIWILNWDLTLRTVGSAASLMHSGSWQSESNLGSAASGTAGQGAMAFPQSAPAVGTTFDSTATNVVDLTAQWSISNAGNSIQTHTYILESLN